MEGYAEILAADRRLVALRLLVEAGGELGESALEKGLHMYGHRTRVDREVVRQDLRWMAGLALPLVALEVAPGDVLIAAITMRGVSVAQGKIEVEGVAAPAIGR